MRCKYVKMVKYAFLQKKRTSSSAFMIVHTKTISKLQNTCLYSETFIFQDYVRTLREPICCCQKMNCTYLLEKDSDGVTFPQKEIENLLWKLKKKQTLMTLVSLLKSFEKQQPPHIFLIKNALLPSQRKRLFH